MKVLGLIVEYNPFHNGHIYHIQKAKELVQPDITVAIMSGNFVQRGEPAIVDKWTRCDIALQHGIDLVIELPFVHAIQSADYFAQGAIGILHYLQVTDIVFGSENGKIDTFKEIAYTIKKEETTYNQHVQSFMKQGYRYPDACNQALALLLNKTITTPNDLLGLAYVKEIIQHNYSITMHCIPRTNDFHSTELQNISSATAIREALRKQQDISEQLPNIECYQNAVFFDSLFPLLKYKILTTSSKELSQLHLVEEGLENLLKKNIILYHTMDTYINSLTSRRYTKSRIQRMIIHVLMNNHKEDIIIARKSKYIRILGMNKNGRSYIHSIKKSIPIDLVSSFKGLPTKSLETKVINLYSCLTKDPNKTIKEEYSRIPILK